MRRDSGRIYEEKKSPRYYELYRRYSEVALYLFFGGLTFLISVISYAICLKLLGMDVLVANIISWIIAVLFAFFTNRRWVFKGKSDGAKDTAAQLASFIGDRLFTLAMEELILWVFVTRLGMNDIAIKIVAQIVVIVLNYFISKFMVFRKK